MYLSHGPGRGEISTGRLISWSLLYKAWMAGTPPLKGGPEFANQLRKHKDLSFRIESIKEIKLYADAAVSVGTPVPFKLIEILFEFTWGENNKRLAEMPFIVVTHAQFAGI